MASKAKNQTSLDEQEQPEIESGPQANEFQLHAATCGVCGREISDNRCRSCGVSAGATSVPQTVGDRERPHMVAGHTRKELLEMLQETAEQQESK